MLKRLRPANSVRARRSEQGQILVLFVVLFSFVLALAAFSIDQGFWYGKRRVVQKDVDAAARSGAMAFLGDNYDACDQAQQTAGLNGATLSASTGCDADGKCVTTRSEQEVTLAVRALLQHRWHRHRRRERRLRRFGAGRPCVPGR